MRMEWMAGTSFSPVNSIVCVERMPLSNLDTWSCEGVNSVVDYVLASVAAVRHVARPSQRVEQRSLARQAKSYDGAGSQGTKSQHIRNGSASQSAASLFGIGFRL
jgi:hypothetical protein